MHVIRKRAFEEAARRFSNDKTAIMDAYRVLNSGTFNNPEKLKQIFPSLDNFKYKEKWYVIDISGNNLRIMAMVLFTNQKFYVKHIVTHAEYNKLCRKYRKEKQ